MFLSGLCARDANNVQSKVTDLRRELKGRLKIKLFFLHPGVLYSGVLTIIPDSHSRAFVKGKGGGGLLHCVCAEEFDGEGWSGLNANSLVELTWRVGESVSELKKKVANGVVTVTNLCFFR